MKFELKILFSLSVGLFAVAIFILLYSLYSIRFVEEPVSEILSASSTERFGEAFDMLSSLHIFTNIDKNPPPPEGKVAEIISRAKEKMQKNEALSAEEKRVLSEKISYYLHLARELKRPMNSFNKDDHEFLKLLLEFRKAANHNSFVFGFFTLAASAVIFLAGILFHLIHQKKI